MSLPFWTRVSDMGFEGDMYSPNPELLVIIDGIKVPGISRVKAAPELQVDFQKVNGEDGASLVARGYMPGPIEIETVIWTPPQWTAMQAVIARIWTKPGKIATTEKKVDKGVLAEQSKVAEQRSRSIEHPYLALFGISAVVVVGISPPEPGPFEQSRTIRIKCIEYVPKGPTTKKKAATAVIKGVKQSVGIAPQLASKLPPKNSPTITPDKTEAGPTKKAKPASGSI